MSWEGAEVTAPGTDSGWVSGAAALYLALYKHLPLNCNNLTQLEN